MITYEIIEGQDLYNLLKYQRNKLQSLCVRIPYFDGNCMPHYTAEDTKYMWFVAKDKEEIVAMLLYKVGGMSDFQASDYNNFMMSVGVDHRYRNRGIATKLIWNLFIYAKEHNLSILQSSYSHMGGEYIKHVFEQFAEEYPEVDYYDKNTNLELT
jgi:GNAT superfamily N-acetyltransferase